MNCFSKQGENDKWKIEETEKVCAFYLNTIRGYGTMFAKKIGGHFQ